jgi:hypothetical protein
MGDITYCTTDLTRWGIGVNRLLHDYEVDINFYNVEVRLGTLEHALVPTRGILSIQQINSTQMTITLTDNTVEGPFTMPVVSHTWRGTWAPSTQYYAGDGFTINNSVYIVLIDHVSALTFNPNATDGHGNNLYGLQLTVAGALPAGGTTGQTVIRTAFGYTWAFLDLSQLGDVALTSPLDANDFLMWNGHFWTNTDLSVTFSQITDILLTAITDGDFLRFSAGLGGKWTNLPLAVSDRRNSLVTALAASGGALLDATLGDVFSLTPTASETVDCTGGIAGAHVSIVITTIGITSFAITFGANFKSQGVLNTGGTGGVVWVVSFVGDGVNLNEIGRTGPM